MQILSSHQKETSDYIKKGKQLAAAAAEHKRGPLSLASVDGPNPWMQTSKRCLCVHVCGTEQVQHGLHYVYSTTGLLHRPFLWTHRRHSAICSVATLGSYLQHVFMLHNAKEAHLHTHCAQRWDTHTHTPGVEEA